jgi:cytochrome c-type biogenesis protein CcmF
VIPEFGQFALASALVIAVVQMATAFAGCAPGMPAHILIGICRRAAQAQFFLVAAAFGCLIASYVTTDLSVANVVANSHSAKPLLYKIAGVWGNHEGSMLLWSLILALFGILVASFDRTLLMLTRGRVLGVMGFLAAAFLLFILAASNPFSRLDVVPPDGQDLNPILQDPALAFHPPFLYLGYVGLSVSYAFAIAALLEGRVDAAWARRLRPWILLAWTALTIGIALGSWWAYYELGWGGFWFWDPVENASLMPWLAATALLHATLIVERRGAMKSWAILLAIVAFSLSLLGTFLVRSGVLTSVHAFASDPLRGVFILLILGLSIGGALFLFALRANQLKVEEGFSPVSRESALLVNNVLLIAGCGAVFVGTLYPLLLDVLQGPRIFVGPPYFAWTFVPLMLALLILVPFGPLLRWKQDDLKRAAFRLWPVGIAAVLAALAGFYCQESIAPLGPLGLALSIWICLGAAAEIGARILIRRGTPGTFTQRLRNLPANIWASTLAHGGLGVALAGIVGVTAWQGEQMAVLQPGEEVKLAGFRFVLEKIVRVEGVNYQAERALLTIEQQGKVVGHLHPERRYYPVKGSTTTEAAIRTTIAEDLYAVLGEEQPGGGYGVRLYYNPLAPLIWIGALIMAAGGALAFMARRNHLHRLPPLQDGRD